MMGNAHIQILRVIAVLGLMLILNSCGSGQERQIIDLREMAVQGKDVLLNEFMGLSSDFDYEFEIIEGPSFGKLLGENVLALTYISNNEFTGEEKLVLNIDSSSGEKFNYRILLDIVPATTIISGGTLDKLTNPASQTPASLVRHLQLITSVPSTLLMTITGSDSIEKTFIFDTLQTEHSHLIWAFEENSSYDVTLLLRDQYGFSSDPIKLNRVITDPLPENMFQLDFQGDPALTPEPGVTMILASEKGPNAHTYSIAVDNDGSIVGMFEDEFYGFTRDGSMLFFQPPVTFIEYEPLEGQINTVVLIDTSLAMHHDLKKLPNGNFLSLDRKDRTVTSFPIDVSDQSLIADVEVIDDVVIEIDPFGNTVNEWSMMDMLDSRRIGFLSLKQIRGSYDWGHANSVSYDEEQDSILVSLRAQDAIVSFDKASGTLNYILGNHNNWDSDLQEYLLNPVGEVDWPYGQHDIQPLGQNKYSLFDNGNYRASPFSVVTEDTITEATYSRSVVYEVDPVARTISTLFEFRPDPAIFARAVGSTQVLPETGNMLSNFGVLTELPDSTVRSAKIIETSGSDLSEVVSTISVSNSISDWGVRVYRAWKLPVDYRSL